MHTYDNIHKLSLRLALGEFRTSPVDSLYVAVNELYRVSVGGS